MDACYSLADSVNTLSFEGLPQKTVDIAKKCILDSIGCALASCTQSPEANQIVELVKEAGGTSESTVLGFGYKVPCHMASLANGALCHALDYDQEHKNARN